jgi:hypothetical protein
LALKKLAEQLAKLDDDSPVSFSFRGGVLTISQPFVPDLTGQ